MNRRTFLGCTAAAWGAAAGRDFVLGTYQLPNAADPWREAKEAGFDVVRVAPRRAELDLAAKAGLRAWTAVGSDPAKVRATVAELKNHPALAFWETEDEPSYQYNKPGPRVTPERMIAAYRAVKSVDPDRPVYVNHSPTNLVSTLKRYNPGADILGTDIYPVAPRGLRPQYALWPDGLHGDLLNPYLSQVGQYADKMRAVGGAEKRQFLTLQAFAWESLRKQGDRDEKLIQYPTRAQLRFMCFQAIVHGVEGLLFWGLHTVPRQAAFWPELKVVVREISDLKSILSSENIKSGMTVEHHEMGHSVDRGIEWSLKGGVVLAVNADRWPADVTLRGPKGTQRVKFEAFGTALLRGLF